MHDIHIQTCTLRTCTVVHCPSAIEYELKRIKITITLCAHIHRVCVCVCGHIQHILYDVIYVYLDTLSSKINDESGTLSIIER